MFLKYGKEPNKSGYEKRWDYSNREDANYGTGDSAAVNPDQYNKLWEGFILSKIRDSLGKPPPSDRDFTVEELEEVITSYRGLPRRHDPRYFRSIARDYWYDLHNPRRRRATQKTTK